MLKSKLVILALAGNAALLAQTTGPQILPVTPTRFDAFVGESFSQTFTCPACPTNTVITLSPQNPLPTGLTYSATTRTLSGIPSSPNQASAFSIIATAGKMSRISPANSGNRST